MNAISSPQSTPTENHYINQSYECKKCSLESNLGTPSYTNFTDLCSTHLNLVKNYTIELYNAYPEDCADWKRISQKIYERTQLAFKPSNLRQRFFTKLNQKLDFSKITPEEGVIINSLARNGKNRWREVALDLQKETKSTFLRSASLIRYWYNTYGEGASTQKKTTATKHIPLSKKVARSNSRESLKFSAATTSSQVFSDSIRSNHSAPIAQACNISTQLPNSLNTNTIYTQLRSIPKDKKDQLDTLILTQYKTYHPNDVKWKEIAANIAKTSPFHIPAIRLKDHFFHYLDPNLDKSPIKEPEASRICELALRYQNEWTVIAKLLYEEKMLRYEITQDPSQSIPPKIRSAEMLRHWYRSVGELNIKYNIPLATTPIDTTIPQRSRITDSSMPAIQDEQSFLSANSFLFETINFDYVDDF